MHNGRENLEFNAVDEFRKVLSSPKLERGEKLDDFLELQTRQRIGTALFIGEMFSELKNTEKLAEEQIDSLVDEFTKRALWTTEQRLEVLKSVRDVNDKSIVASSLLEKGRVDKKQVYKNFFGHGSGEEIDVRKVPGGLVFLASNKSDFERMCSADNPFSVKEMEQSGYFYGQYLQNYKGSSKESRQFDYSIIAINLTDIDRHVLDYEKKYGLKLSRESLVESTINHETFHLWKNNYFTRKLFTKESIKNHRVNYSNDDEYEITASLEDFRNVSENMQNEIIAHLMEGEDIDRIIRIIKDYYVPHSETYALKEKKVYKTRIESLLVKLPALLDAGRQIINFFDGDVAKASVVLWSEEISKWPRLKDQLFKYGNLVEKAD